MSDPFVAEIRIFPFTFAPKGWAFCIGEVLLISQNKTLFSILGTTYGGDGKSTFGLPDLKGRAVMQPGQGQGLSLRDLGEKSGSTTITLLQSEIPAHTHTLRAAAVPADQPAPGGNLTATVTNDRLYAPASSALAPMASQALPPAGGNQPHDNMQPYLVLNFCIALVGDLPQRP